MTDQTSPYYLKRSAGDPVTIEDDLEKQKLIKEDIRNSIKTAIDNLEQVDKAGDAEKFGGKTPEEYAKAIVDRVLATLPKRTGYMMVFKDLKVAEQSVVKHSLGAFPLTDLYQLDYFRVIASENEHIYETFTNFYIYHSGEGKIRFRPEETPTVPAVAVLIDPPEPPPYRIPFQRMLELYDVKYDNDMSLGDLETDFWKAFFSDPNDLFDDDQYCHSPWFDECCREMRTVRHIMQRKEWDDIWFVVRPRKTINFHFNVDNITDPRWAPNKIQVVHFDFDTLGLLLLEAPDYPAALTIPDPIKVGFPPADAIKADHMKVMALLKV